MRLTRLNPLRQLRDAPFALKLGVIVGTLVLATVGTLLSVMLALTISSGVRAFVAGEGLWSKGQKDSVYFITRFLQTRDAQDYAAFQQAIAVPLGDRTARLELLKPDFDRRVATQGFIGGGNAPEDVPSMILLVRDFGWIDFVAEALGIWGAAEQRVIDLQNIGTEIQAAVAAGTLDHTQELAIQDRIDQINAAVTPLENRFSQVLSQGARTVQWQLLFTVLAVSAVLLGSGLAVAWIIGLDLRRSIEALREGAQRIADGELDHRLIPRGRDELAQLMLAFNVMAARRNAVDVQLRNANQLHQRVMEHSTNAIYTMDREGRFTSANRRTSEITGYPIVDLIGLPWAKIVDPAYLPDLYPRFADTIAGRGPILNYEVPLTRPDGSVVQITFSITALLHEGEIVGVVGAAEDTTERKRAEAELIRSNRELEHFAFVVSHDLQEPLTTVSGFSRLLKQRYRTALDTEGQQWIDHIIRGCSGMQSLIEDLLAYARVSRTAAGLEPTDLADSVRKALDQLKGTLDAAGAMIEVGPLPTIPAYPRQMVQLFQNLIGNAAKFRSEAPLKISISAQPAAAGGWTLRVRDNGIGIPEASRKEVFGLFHRLHRRDRHSGNGIGLTICKRIVELHQGEIWIEDGDPGTVFVIALGRAAAGNKLSNVQNEKS
jgi:PAS domain S-box-containing protein